VYEAQPDDSNNDQIKRDDIIQQPRRDQNKNSCDQRDDGLDVGNAKGHDLFLRLEKKTTPGFTGAQITAAFFAKQAKSEFAPAGA
jgi:hypothetical protein